MESFSDEILLQIFVRLPDSRSMIECRSVCKRWLSLIIYSEPLIYSFFLSQPSLFKHVIGFHDVHRGFLRPYFEITFSKSKNFCSGGPLVLDFSPWPEEETNIRAAFRDLMLVSRRHLHKHDNPQLWVPLPPIDFAVCNPTTKQGVILPPAPENAARWWGLVCSDDSSRFSVVLLVPVRRLDLELLQTLVFCSDTGMWEEKSLIDVSEGWGNVFTMGGAIHLPGRSAIVSYDPFIDSGMNVSLPLSLQNWHDQNFDLRVVGFVAGRLRLWQLVGNCLIKIWELEPRLSSSLLSLSLSEEPLYWREVHSVDVSRRMPTKGRLAKLALHPENVDEVFMVFKNHTIWVYNILKDSFEGVAQLPVPENYRHSNTSIDIFTLYALPPLDS